MNSDTIRLSPEVTTEDLAEFVQRLQITISDPEVLRIAVTHRSFLGETTGFESNERLEFLGDSVLGLVVSEYLFCKMVGQPEGELARAKSVAVSEPYLAEAARNLDFQRVMQISTGEHLSGGRDRDSILCDMYEAVIGVIYLDQGLDVARSFILRSLASILEQVSEGVQIRDYKSHLQQLTQASKKVTPLYRVVNETGADHDKTFTIQVELNGHVLGQGVGKSKKSAEQAAAKEALDKGLFLLDDEDAVH